MENQVRSAALACVLGASIGDALGAPIEFELPVTEEEVAGALTMAGGGTHGTGPGQATDDTEMAICLASGLILGGGKLDMDIIARYYSMWVLSEPFGLGRTCGIAFRAFFGAQNIVATLCINKAIERNQKSESNGTLMRISSLCVWAHRLPPEKAARAARIEASMTHSNETIHHANAAYLLAVCHLINHFGDRSGAYDSARSYAFSNGDSGLQSWFTHIENEPPMPVEYGVMGWAKIGFTYAFRHLRAGSDYMTTMREVLALGGDTDTNAAIAGGLIGAAVGYAGLPTEYVNKVLSYSYKEKGGIERPDFLSQNRIINYTDQLIAMAPVTARLIIGEVEEEL